MGNARQVHAKSVPLAGDYFTARSRAGAEARAMVRDGKLSPAELDRLDGDGDGRLTAAEVRAAGFTDQVDAGAIAKAARASRQGFAPLQVRLAPDRPHDDGEALLMDHFGLDWISARPGRHGTGVHANGHPGIDLVARAGATTGKTLRPLVGPTGGTVILAGRERTMGNFVFVRDNGTGLLTKYMHLHKSPSVRKGQAVTAQSQLGQVGNTGFSTGAHLHFEVRDSRNRVVAPAEYARMIARARRDAAAK